MRDRAAKRGKHVCAFAGWRRHEKQCFQNALHRITSQVDRRARTADLQQRRPVVESLICDPVLTARVNICWYCHYAIPHSTDGLGTYKRLPRYRVSYGDASHFSGEYKRAVGEPPMQDVERLRGNWRQHDALAVGHRSICRSPPARGASIVFPLLPSDQPQEAGHQEGGDEIARDAKKGCAMEGRRSLVDP